MNKESPFIKFNPLKHHLQYLTMKMTQWLKMDWEQVYNELLELGENQFDLYLGNLTPEVIMEEIKRQLEVNGIITPGALREYLGPAGYKSLKLPDGSRWIIRISDTGPAFVHLHPGRNQPMAYRIKAAHLKTAVALFYESHGQLSPGSVFSTSQINTIRISMLGLSPVRSIEESRKITETVRFINGHS